MKTAYLNKGTELECIYDSNIVVIATGEKPIDDYSFIATVKSHLWEHELNQTKTFLRKEFTLATEKKYKFLPEERLEFTKIVDELLAQKLLTPETEDVYQEVWCYLTEQYNTQPNEILDTRFGIYLKLNYILKGYDK